MKTETMAVIGIVLLVAISSIAVVVLDGITGQEISLKTPHPVPNPNPPIPGRNTHAIQLTGPSESST
jgi:hypothetical protein